MIYIAVFKRGVRPHGYPKTTSMSDSAESASRKIRVHIRLVGEEGADVINFQRTLTMVSATGVDVDIIYVALDSKTLAPIEPMCVTCDQNRFVYQYQVMRVATCPGIGGIRVDAVEAIRLAASKPSPLSRGAVMLDFDGSTTSLARLNMRVALYFKPEAMLGEVPLGSIVVSIKGARRVPEDPDRCLGAMCVQRSAVFEQIDGPVSDILGALL